MFGAIKSALKKLLGGDKPAVEAPAETIAIVDGAMSTKELLEGLDKQLTRNEVETRKLQKEITNIETQERDLVARVAGGIAEPRQKKFTLQQIQLLRKQMDNVDQRLAILHKNMTLHLNLIGKVQAMEAMQLQGVTEPTIEQVLEEFDSALADFQTTMETMHLGSISEHEVSTELDPELAAIEQEILKSAPEPTTPVAEKQPVAEKPEPTKPEPTKPEPAAGKSADRTEPEAE
jgi:hypothetical protein